MPVAFDHDIFSSSIGNNINWANVIGHKDFDQSQFTKNWNGSSEISKPPKWKEISDKGAIEGSSPNVTLPRYLSLEPSLAMDWLEISWDELEINERIGAGSSFSDLVFFLYLLNEADFPYVFIFNA